VNGDAETGRKRPPSSLSLLERAVLVGVLLGIASAVVSCGGGPGFSARHLARPTDLSSVSCPSVRSCVAAGAGGEVEVTDDYGRLWHVVATPSHRKLTSVACSSDTDCVAVGVLGTVVATSDGGMSWSTVKVRSLKGQNVNGVTCTISRVCIAVGAFGTVVRSEDAGMHWQLSGSLSTPLTSVSCYRRLCATVSLRTGLSTPAEAFVSNDAGVSWLGQQVDPFKNLYGVQCTSPKSCTAVGEDGAVDSTVDGGGQWRVGRVEDFAPLVSVTCVVRRPCLVGGEFGAIYRWLGGSKWEEVAPATGPLASREVVESIACPTAKRCWAVGDQGTILFSGDSGATWSARVTTPAGSDPRVLLVGDSVAQTIGEELPTIAPAYGLYGADEGVLGCGIAQGEPVMAGGVTYDSVAPACNGQPGVPQWPDYWAQYVSQLRPQITVLLAGYWEVCDRMFDGSWSNILEPRYQSYIKGELETAVRTLSADGARVVLLTSPYFDTGNFPEDEPRRVDIYNALVRQVASEYPSIATVIDLNAFVDPGGSFASTVDGVTVRQSDGEHFSTAGSTLVMRWLLPQVKALLAHQ
jgi:photosystem II stability/assembly factor-like uncharacterized protein